MRTEEERRQFILFRVQGWSINKIAKHINVPRATVWRWDHDDRDMLQILKAMRFEELQEKFVPTYEEELEQLSAYRDRIRNALANHDFSTMKPEFLLQMDLQISSRLAKFRANVGVHADPEPACIPGCVSRTEVPYTGVEPDDDSTVAAAADPAGSTEQPSAPTLQHSSTNGDASAQRPSASALQNSTTPVSKNQVHQPSQNGPFRDKTAPGSKRDDSASTTSDEKNGPVPISELLKLANDFNAKLRSMKPNGNGSPPRPSASALQNSSTPSRKNGPSRDKTPRGSKRDNSASTTSEQKNGPVPFSANERNETGIQSEPADAALVTTDH